MERGLPRTLRFIALILLLGIPVMAVAAPRQTVRRQLPPHAVRFPALERLPANRTLELSIGLPLRNQQALANLLRELYDPSRPGFRRYLTPQEFAERFGPTEQDYRELEAFAAANGLRVSGRHPNRLILDVAGPVSAIEKAVQVRLNVYRHPAENRSFFAPDAEPSLEVGAPVLGISGLDDFYRPRPLHVKPANWGKDSIGTPHATGSGPRGNFLGRDFRAAYAPGVQLDGAGESVALFELDGYYPADITAYTSLAGLAPASLSNVLLNSFSGAPGQNNLEVALDIDMAIAMAPGLSRVIVYEGRNPNDILNRIATDNLARQISCSWGFGSQVDPVRSQIFMQYAAQGQSFFQASGDLGAYPADVFPPSDDPYVTVVGGTVLTTEGSGGAWVSESVWPEGGGGISTSFGIPSWQIGLSNFNNHASATMRNIPDVACLADTVIWVIANNGEQGAIGGTSASAPLWAGFAALANQQAALSGKPAIGFINPALSAIARGPAYASTLHDVVTGNNTNSSSPLNYFATAGYDLCTGWGTPAGSNLITALLDPPDSLQITPSTTLTAHGPVGGPFALSYSACMLTNWGPLAIDWTLTQGASWLRTSPTNGTLAPGDPSVTVSLELASAATNLSAGNYISTLWFTNLADRYGQGRQFVLSVVTPPVITLQPTSQTVLASDSATFIVGTTSNAQQFFQWRRDNGVFLTNLVDATNLAGARSSTLTIRSVSSADLGAYSVIVSNAAGVAVSSNALLGLVPWRPSITSQPADQTVLPGATVEFTVGAVGSSPLIYQWLRDGTNLADSANLKGAATPVLSLSNIVGPDAGTFSVLVSNVFGSVLSTGALLTVTPDTAPGTALTVLASFPGGSAGAAPNGLVQGGDGSFYGTTQIGGSNAAGTSFRLSADGTLTTLYSLNGGSDGSNPRAALTPGPDGALYGTAFQGGESDNGTVFRLHPDGAFDTLVSFNITNGDFPRAKLISSGDNGLYGTSYQGGGYGRGSVYRVSTNGNLVTLYSFTGTNDGGFPCAELAPAADGSFCGTTFKGGAYGKGSVFKLGTNGVLTTLVSFDGTNGAFPYAGLAKDNAGSYYGATSSGGGFNNGTVFKLSASGQFTNLHHFTSGVDGAQPSASLLLADDGNFYGTTAVGGNYGVGTVFRMSPGGSLQTLVQFHGLNGAYPNASLIQASDGLIYGTTPNGGAAGQGTFFRFATVGAPAIGEQPVGQTVFAGADVSLEISVVGSRPFFFQWQTSGSNLVDGGNVSGVTSRLLSFKNVTPANAGSYAVTVTNPLGHALSSTALLTVTSSPPLFTVQPTNQTLAPGGVATFVTKAIGNLPLVCRWQRGGTDLTDNATLSGAGTEVLTLKNVTEANNGSYTLRVSNNLGTVFSSAATLSVMPVSASGTRFTTLYFGSSGNDIDTPNGLMRANDGFLYGTSAFGGARRLGTVFRLSPAGTVSILASLGGTNGSIPRAGLVQGTDGALYGTAPYGGSVEAGTVYRISTNGSASALYSFTGDVDGAYPMAALVQGADGSLYGSTETCGTAGYGTLFRVTTSGAFSSLYSFTNGVDGAAPTSALLLGQDGNFYGTTGSGGTSNLGNVFRLTPAGGFANLYSFTGGMDGSYPGGALIQATDGGLYGTARNSSLRGYPLYGNIFKVSTAGQCSTVYLLNYGDGSYPRGGVIQGPDGNFYGATYSGGANGFGTIFRVSSLGSYTTLINFDGFDTGGNPASALVLGTDASLYGTTTTGGPGGRGTVFRLSLAPQITRHPTNLTVLPGATAIFRVTALSSLPASYQWQRNGTNLPGGTLSKLTLNGVQPAMAGNYSVLVSNAFATVRSDSAGLRVIPILGATTVSNLLTLSWDGGLTLQSATNVVGPYCDLVGAQSPFLVTNRSEPQRYYRLRAPSAGQVAFGVVAAGGTFNLRSTGLSGYSYVIEASTNLFQWLPLQTNPVPFSFSDTNAAVFPQRFYRTRFLR